MADCPMFSNDWRDFLKDYSFVDSEEVYTNGSLLIPVFRVEQLIEHLMESQLHEQEPRVTAKEELKFLRHNDVVWLEDYDKPEVIPGIVWRRSTVDTDFVICGGGARGKDEDYEVRWRCWTSRPDDKRRAETPWN